MKCPSSRSSADVTLASIAPPAQPSAMSRLLLTLLIVGWALVLFRLWGGGFTGGDEGFTATASEQLGGVFRAAWIMATSQARFYQLVFYPLAQVPYLIDSLAWTNTFRIASSGSAVAAFFIFTNLFYGRRIALMSSFLLLGLQDTVGGGYNPFHALPMWFSFGMALYFFSLYLYVQATIRGKANGIAYSIFFCSLLTYEPMLFYSLAFPAIWLKLILLKKTESSNGFFKNISFFFNKNKGLFVAIFVYCGCYFIFRKIFPPQYVGVSGFTWTTFHDFFRTVYTLSIKGIYTNYHLEWLTQYRAEPIAFSIAAVIGIVGSALLEKKRPSSPTLKNTLSNSTLIIPFIFFPNVLFGLTDRYREWAKHGPYIGSYYSSFALCLFAAVFICTFSYNNDRSTPIYKIVVAICRVAVLLGFGYVAYCNHYQSIDFFAKSRVDANRWTAVDQLANAVRRQNLNLPEKICSKSLLTSSDPYDYWSFYLSNLAKRPTKIVYEDAKEVCPDSLDKVGEKYVLSTSSGKVIWEQAK